MLVDFGKAGLIEKARQQPEKVREVIQKARTDGVAQTITAVRNKLDHPLALGYCNVGRVLEVGQGVTDFAVGDRVASNGYHAEVVVVPTNLCAKIPDKVDNNAAAFTVIGAIALQGIRLVQPTLGETVAVSGLGLIGLVTVQILRAHGCRVIGLDFDDERLALARSYGAEVVNLAAGADPVQAAKAYTDGYGVDAVIITAATRSSEPVHQAAHMCRKRGRIVLVGMTGLELSRADFFEKELTFQVSCSYGPGRYDASYEKEGLDYPIGFVRWTEQRNFGAVLDMLADGNLDTDSLISHQYPIGEAEAAYTILANAEPALGMVLEYSLPDEKPDPMLLNRRVGIASEPVSKTAGSRIAFIGSGSYATGVLLPAFKKAGAKLVSIVSSGGVSGVHAARKYGADAASTDADSIIADPEIDAVVITTRHDSHARFVLAAIAAGKQVFVEKPLCLTHDELDQITAAYDERAAAGDPPMVMIGFNRRFAPHVAKMKSILDGQSGPKAMVMTVNAGAIPHEHWTQDVHVGGGRIIGEACHFIDLMRYLAGRPITTHHIQHMDAATGDTATITLGFEDGSTGTIHYFANGSKAFPKERLEVFSGGRILQLDNFRVLRGYGWRGFKSMKLWSQDKGQRACAQRFTETLEHGGQPPIPFDEITEVTRITLALAETRGSNQSD
ncbi:MAG: bi-domain-containing oxidoreductase [Hyphomicrobiaceae bacterium]